MRKTKRRHGHEVDWQRPTPGQVRVYVWEWPVRFSHWVMVASILTLSITGYYMHDPYIVPHGRGAYVMGTMRFIHILFGFAFAGAIALRIVWLFAGNRWARWEQFVPSTKERLKDLAETGKYYAFMAWSPKPHIGHNAMAGASYIVMYGLAVAEIFTGMALYSRVLGSKLVNILWGWPLRILDVQWLREIHFFVMFVFWMFFIHHVYTAILVSIEEENGVMESIFSGYKFVPEHEVLEEMGDEWPKSEWHHDAPTSPAVRRPETS